MAKSIHRPLNDLQLLPGVSLPNFAQQKFRRCTAHIAAMFLRALKQRSDYTLDGSPLLFVYFGVPEAQREMLGKANYFRESKGNWSSCCAPKFDWEDFSALSDQQQDEATTKLLQKALLSAAKAAGADSQLIKAAAKAIREHDYSLRFPIEKLTCTRDDGEMVAHVYSVITRGFIRWQIEIQNAQGQLLQSDFVPDECYSKPDFTEDRVTSRWKRDTFSIVQANGRAAYSLKIVR